MRPEQREAAIREAREIFDDSAILDRMRAAGVALDHEQIAEAVVQAAEAGDFVKHVQQLGGGRAVVYTPGMGAERLRLEVERLRGVMRDVVGVVAHLQRNDVFCVCGLELDEHAPDCTIAALLREAGR